MQDIREYPFLKGTKGGGSFVVIRTCMVRMMVRVMLLGLVPRIDSGGQEGKKLKRLVELVELVGSIVAYLATLGAYPLD
ncbi:uncharacterized protein F4822DRAFT_396410 [Hypoxylon trugodes]|uniref:uncharacterized protein n=1 Tax=Hypoxylon trugodes TaxID=326681 RepID=UPI0021A0890F|nr:uncharacterized protein F4822DRAFT_396410 [Hypoxylon trugodes]KAI1391331.1 hypothetical protein F4822DRAFT_396410 [Hypoxylon trugodes]